MLAEHIDAHRKRVLGDARAALTPALFQGEREQSQREREQSQGEREQSPEASTQGRDAAAGHNEREKTQSHTEPALPVPSADKKANKKAPQALTLTGLYNVLTALREGRALTAKEKIIHLQGLVGVLRELHDELDAAVLAAYGLPAAASTDDILTHLVQLNTERALEEAQGRVAAARVSEPQKVAIK